MPITLTKFCLYITSTQCKIEVENISSTNILKYKLPINIANIPRSQYKKNNVKTET